MNQTKQTKQMTKDLAYYLSLPYTRRVRVERDKGGEYFVAYVEELGGLESDGLTEAEARYNLQLAFVDYVTALLARSATIAEPESWPGADLAAAGVVARRGWMKYLRGAFRKAPKKRKAGRAHGVPASQPAAQTAAPSLVSHEIFEPPEGGYRGADLMESGVVTASK